jgi:5-hydroxyisourate hydrolase-like protein (transthyretin family)
MISTQVIDISLGRPAATIPIVLDFFVTGHGWREIGQGVSDSDGIVESFGPSASPGIYRLTYDIAAYRSDPFFPSILVMFEVGASDEECHLALHVSPYGYAVSRG